MFFAGASLFDILQPLESVSEWEAIADSPVVKSKPDWHFKVLIGLLNVSSSPAYVLQEILGLDLDYSDRQLRDGLIYVILTRDLTVPEDVMANLAQIIRDGKWDARDGRSKKKLQRIGNSI